MDLNTFIISVFCLIDDWLKEEPKLRQRGPKPELCDSEVLTIEIIGEFLGIDFEKDLFAYFRRYYGEFFPALRKVHRTTFTRQAANLWIVKERLWRHLLDEHIHFDPLFSLVDSFPVAVCRFARAYRCRILAQESAFGFDEMNQQTLYGFRAHLHVCWPGVIVGSSLAPANDHELSVAEGLLEETRGWVLGDRNYWSPSLTEGLRRQGLELLAPYKFKQSEVEGHRKRAIESPGPDGWCTSAAG